jgi:hypothetical protein
LEGFPIVQRFAQGLAVVAALAAFTGAPAFAQGYDVDPAPGAPGPYAGASKDAFYSVEARIAAVEARIGALAPRTARGARGQLMALKAFEAQQRARHGGELRDWDREAITARLNRLEAMVGIG